MGTTKPTANPAETQAETSPKVFSAEKVCHHVARVRAELAVSDPASTRSSSRP